MKVEMYKNIRDDAEKEGYVAVSHVWGDQKMYLASQFGITGVDWEIPLSDPNKVSRFINAMKNHKMKYCWWDIFCMPQGEDRQWEVNLEIPLMGDYYNGAKMTFVLSDIKHYVSRLTEVLDELNDINKGENKLLNIEGLNLNMFEEKWFTRIWTYQEAVLSKEIILVDVEGTCNNLSNVIEKVLSLSGAYRNILGKIIGPFGDTLASLSNSIENYRDGACDLADVISSSVERESFKVEDRFYGALGILGYKDFPVDYNVYMYELYCRIIKHAHSKGDISWMSINTEDISDNYHPNYETLWRLSKGWKEDIPGVCEIELDKWQISMKAAQFGTITDLARRSEHGKTYKYMCDSADKMGFTRGDVYAILAGYDTELISDELFGEAADQISTGKPLDEKKNKFAKMQPILHESMLSLSKLTAVKATNIFGENIMLMVRGVVCVGNQIMLLRMHDYKSRCFGIVVNGKQRNGMFVYKDVKLDDKLYTKHSFIL